VLLRVILLTIVFRDIREPLMPRNHSRLHNRRAGHHDSPSAVSPIEQAEKNGTALRISLKDLTKLALENNLDIAISDTRGVVSGKSQPDVRIL